MDPLSSSPNDELSNLFQQILNESIIDLSELNNVKLSNIFQANEYNESHAKEFYCINNKLEPFGNDSYIYAKSSSHECILINKTINTSLDYYPQRKDKDVFFNKIIKPNRNKNNDKYNTIVFSSSAINKYIIANNIYQQIYEIFPSFKFIATSENSLIGNETINSYMIYPSCFNVNSNMSNFNINNVKINNGNDIVKYLYIFKKMTLLFQQLNDNYEFNHGNLTAKNVVIDINDAYSDHNGANFKINILGLNYSSITNKTLKMRYVPKIPKQYMDANKKFTDEELKTAKIFFKQSPDANLNSIKNTIKDIKVFKKILRYSCAPFPFCFEFYMLVISICLNNPDFCDFIATFFFGTLFDANLIIKNGIMQDQNNPFIQSSISYKIYMLIKKNQNESEEQNNINKPFEILSMFDINYKIDILNICSKKYSTYAENESSYSFNVKTIKLFDEIKNINASPNEIPNNLFIFINTNLTDDAYVNRYFEPVRKLHFNATKKYNEALMNDTTALSFRNQQSFAKMMSKFINDDDEIVNIYDAEISDGTNMSIIDNNILLTVKKYFEIGKVIKLDNHTKSYTIVDVKWKIGTWVKNDQTYFSTVANPSIGRKRINDLIKSNKTGFHVDLTNDWFFESLSYSFKKDENVSAAGVPDVNFDPKFDVDFTQYNQSEFKNKIHTLVTKQREKFASKFQEIKTLFASIDFNEYSSASKEKMVKFLSGVGEILNQINNNTSKEVEELKNMMRSFFDKIKETSTWTESLFEKILELSSHNNKPIQTSVEIELQSIIQDKIKDVVTHTLDETENNQMTEQQLSLFIGFIDAMSKNLSIGSNKLIAFFGKKRDELFQSISNRADNLNNLYKAISNGADNLNNLYKAINNFYFMKTTNLRKFIKSFKISVDDMTVIKDEKFNYDLFMDFLRKNFPIEYNTHQPEPDIQQLQTEINVIKEDIKKQLQIEVTYKPSNANDDYNLQNPDNIKLNLMQLYAIQCYVKCFNIMNLFDDLVSKQTVSSLNDNPSITVGDTQFANVDNDFLGGSHDIEMDIEMKTMNNQNNRRSTIRRISNNVEIIKSLNDLQHFYAENNNFKQYSQNVLMKLIKPTNDDNIETFASSDNTTNSFVDRLIEILKDDKDAGDLLGINTKIFKYVKSNNVEHNEFIKLIKYNDVSDSTNLIKLASERLNYQIYDVSDGHVKKLSNLDYPSKYILLNRNVDEKNGLNCSELPIEVQNHEYCYAESANTNAIGDNKSVNTSASIDDESASVEGSSNDMTGGAPSKVYGIVVDLILHRGENPSAIEKQNYKCQYSFNELSNEYCEIFGVGCSNKVKKGGRKTINSKYYKQLTKFNNSKTRKNI